VWTTIVVGTNMVTHNMYGHNFDNLLMNKSKVSIFFQKIYYKEYDGLFGAPTPLENETLKIKIPS
jgi:hypothetical protein